MATTDNYDWRSHCNLILGLLIYIMVIFVWGETHINPEKMVHGTSVHPYLGEKYNIHSGDQILKVDGEEVENLDGSIKSLCFGIYLPLLFATKMMKHRPLIYLRILAQNYFKRVHFRIWNAYESCRGCQSESRVKCRKSWY